MAIPIIETLAFMVPLALKLNKVLDKDLKPEFKVNTKAFIVAKEYAILTGSISEIFRKEDAKIITAVAIPTSDATFIPCWKESSES